MARKKTLKSTAKQAVKDFKDEVDAFTATNEQINEEMVGAFLDETTPKDTDTPRISLV
jgi:hypothetical protein